MESLTLEYLRNHFAKGEFVLLTGAGFSVSARDIDGQFLPVGGKLADELYRLCFNKDPDSSPRLQDAFRVAIDKKKNATVLHLQRRFSVRAGDIPEFYRIWFSFPWRRIYTLNIDNLDSACNSKWELPRRINRFSPLSVPPVFPGSIPTGRVLESIHLNGVLEDTPEGITFSDEQYARRLVAEDPAYEVLTTELMHYPFIFVGTPMHESLFWKHLELRGARGERGDGEKRRKSFLISRSLDDMRAMMLKDLNIEWIQMTAEQFANEVLAAIQDSVAPGISVLSHTGVESASMEDSIFDVRAVSGTKSKSKSQYLLGAEPSWDDIISGRSIERECFDTVSEAANRLLESYKDRADGGNSIPGGLLVLTGTACSGKSTALKRLALRLTSSGKKVGWIECQTDISVRSVIGACTSSNRPEILCIDDADRYGHSLSNLSQEVLAALGVKLLVVALRSATIDRVLNPNILGEITKEEHVMSNMGDRDIVGLIEVLEKEHLLGRLTGMKREDQISAFRDSAGRQLIVAMIEATTGQKFEEKIVDEWNDLTESKRDIYELVALSSAKRFPITREMLFLSLRRRTNKELVDLEELISRNIIAENEIGELRSRHRRIAEVLVEELHKKGRLIPEVFARIARGAAYSVSRDMKRNAKPWRRMRTMISHDYLFHAIGLEGARTVYDAIQDSIHWDYHYWLQRGRLELEVGDIKEAERYLNTAQALSEDDPIVLTSYAHMLMKSSAKNPDSSSARERINKGRKLLEGQIAQRGNRDTYPYHVLGSQLISWTRYAKLTKEEKKKLLKGAIEIMDDGIGKHPRNGELKKLRRDLKIEMLQLEVVS